MHDATLTGRSSKRLSLVSRARARSGPRPSGDGSDGLLHLDVLDVDVRPAPGAAPYGQGGGSSDVVVHVTMFVEPERLQRTGLELLLALAACSFRDARPRGLSARKYVEKDTFTAADLVQHLRLDRGAFVVELGFVRGRCVQTKLVAHVDGCVTLETTSRGEAATRWVDALRGKPFLRAVGA